MLKILKSLIVITAVAAIASTATRAVFTDEETSTENTFTAGTLDLKVNDENPLTSALFTAENLAPGERGAQVKVNLQNDGSLEGAVSFKASNKVHSEGTDTEAECEAEGRTWWKGSQTCKNETGTNDGENICGQITYEYCYDTNDNNTCDSSDKQEIVNLNSAVYLGELVPNEQWRALWITPILSENAGNRYQGDTCTMDIEFDFEQVAGVASAI